MPAVPTVLYLRDGVVIDHLALYCPLHSPRQGHTYAELAPQHEFIGLLPCSMTRERYECVRRQVRYMPPWAAALEQVAGSATGGHWLEVMRYAHGSKSDAPVHDWAAFLDPSVVPWWFYAKSGSGVWLEVGRCAVASTKTAMMARLLGEYLAKHDLGLEAAAQLEDEHDAELMRHHAAVWLAHRAGGLAPDKLLQGLQLAASGTHTCARAMPGLLPYSCYRLPGYNHLLSDVWDVPMVALAMLLGYHTLVFPASLTYGGHQGQVEAVSELADMRSVDRGRLLQALQSFNRTSSYKQQYTAGEAAQAVSTMQSSGRLCLRPTSCPGRVEGTCDFASQGPTRRLGCLGHVSWVMRDLPRRTARCHTNMSAHP